MKDNEKVKEIYINMFNIKRFKKSLTIEKMLEKIEKKEKEKLHAEIELSYFAEILSTYKKIFGEEDLSKYIKIDYKITRSTLLRYFKPKQIEFFSYVHVKNPVYASGDYMKMYSTFDIIKECYQHNLKPREVFKEIDAMKYQEVIKKLSSIDELITAYKNTIKI